MSQWDSVRASAIADITLNILNIASINFIVSALKDSPPPSLSQSFSYSPTGVAEATKYFISNSPRTTGKSHISATPSVHTL